MTGYPPELVDDFAVEDPDTGYLDPCACGPLHDWMVAHGIAQSDGSFTDFAASVLTGVTLGVVLCAFVFFAWLIFRQREEF